jgi:hypothetical protein
MKRGQPNRAYLFETRRSGIDDAAANVQVRLRITVVEDVAVQIEPKAESTGGERKEQNDCGDFGKTRTP